MALAIVAVAAITLPGTIQKLTATSRFVLPGPNQANFMSDAEADSLQYVSEQPGPGGVLTNSYIGVAVPPETGRRTYIGDEYWSQPDFSQKQKLVDYLLHGWMSPHQARAFVLSTGARFLIQPCSAHGNLTGLLGPIIQSSHQFGCARVYTIKRATRSSHPSVV